ncbi:MAG: AgmX/PglI C-terminal domain-containing protein [Myxococcota bacterium]
MATRTVCRATAAWGLVLALLLTACGKPEEAKEDKPPAADTQVAEDPSTPLRAAQEALDIPAIDAEAITQLLAKSKDVRTWAEQNRDEEQHMPARLLALRLEVLASAAAILLGDEGMQALRDEGPPVEARLRAVVESLDELEDPAPEFVGRGAAPKNILAVRETALTILGADPGTEDVELNRESTLELAEETTQEGLAVRAIWAKRLAGALEDLKALPPGLRTEQALARAGHLLCPRCREARDAAPGDVTKLLLSESNADGIVCDTAVRAASRARAQTPLSWTGALSTCSSLLPEGSSVEPALLWGHNAILLGLTTTARRLVEAPGGQGALGEIAEAQTSALATALEPPVLLPVAYITEPLPEDLPEDTDREFVAPIEGLDRESLTITRPALGILLIGPGSVRIGLRPILAMEDGAAVSLGRKHSLPAGGRATLSLADLQGLQPDEDGSIPAITSAATEIAKAEKEVAEALPVEVALGSEEEGRYMALGLDALAPGWAVTRILEGLRSAGVRHFRFEQPNAVGASLPLLVRDAPEGVAEVVEAGYERPVITVLSADHVDVWAPRGAVGDPAPAGDPEAEPPEGAEPGYDGVDLVRLRVPAPEPEGEEAEDTEPGLGRETLDLVLETIDYFQRRHGAGPLVHVVAGEGVLAGDVLRVADRFQRREGEALEEPERFWPGTACGTEAHDKLHKTPEGCPTGVAVAFSSITPPSSRGIRDTPRGNVPQPKPKPAPEKPQLGYCDKSDIGVNMRRRKGSFRFCYERELQLEEDLAGRVVVRFTIDTDGSVKSAGIASSTLKSDNVHKCLIRNVKRIRFAKPEGGVCVVRWPFEFKPN